MRPGKGIGQVEREGQTGLKKQGAQVCRLPAQTGRAHLIRSSITNKDLMFFFESPNARCSSLVASSDVYGVPLMFLYERTSLQAFGLTSRPLLQKHTVSLLKLCDERKRQLTAYVTA